MTRVAEHERAFSTERPRLLGLAYRMLGSFAEAEDVVQNVWLRWARADHTQVDNASGWLTTATTRAAIDRRRTVQRQREQYVGPWLPEPLSVGAPGVDPLGAVELSESLTLGFLVVLDVLSPMERAVFLLADVFGESFRSIAAAVGKTEANCRQIASRARRKVRDARPTGSAAAPESLLARLLLALADGDAGSVVDLVAPDVVLVSDGGGRHRAARRPVVGASRVSAYLGSIARRNGSGVKVRRVDVNGAAGFTIDLPDRVVVLDADAVDGKLTQIRMQSNPRKLGGLGAERHVI